MNLSTYQLPNERISQPNETIGKNKKQEKYKEIDQLFNTLPDLVNQKFKAWYCKKFNEIGLERVLILASQARADGNNKQRLFSHLLKK